jgi:hypothetical protein
MAAHFAEVIRKFSDLCNGAYEAWITRQAIFDANPHRNHIEPSEQDRLWLS